MTKTSKSSKRGPIPAKTQRETTIKPGETPDRAPPHPPHFGKVAKTLWKALAKDLKEDGRLTSHTLSTFTAMCEARDMAESCRLEMMESGKLELTTTGAKGVKVQHPAFRTYKECMSQFQSWAKEFALTPSSLARLGVDLSPPKKSAMDKYNPKK